MEENSNNNNNNNNSSPVRSRWTPKSEQIMILESIFNSGMVNPPKDETVNIRKLLQKYGPVGDANVFYWFQNRRSRSRRRQRQIQAAAAATATTTATAGFNNNNNIMSSSSDNNNGGGGYSSSPYYSCQVMMGGNNNNMADDGNYNMFQMMTSSATGLDMDNNSVPIPAPVPYSSSSTNYEFEAGGGGGGLITVFINGVQTEVPRGPLDMKAMFGEEDVILIHSSSGLPFHSLQHGHSYFLVSTSTP